MYHYFWFSVLDGKDFSGRQRHYDYQEGYQECGFQEHEDQTVQTGTEYGPVISEIKIYSVFVRDQYLAVR